MLLLFSIRISAGRQRILRLKRQYVDFGNGNCKFRLTEENVIWPLVIMTSIIIHITYILYITLLQVRISMSSLKIWASSFRLEFYLVGSYIEYDTYMFDDLSCVYSNISKTKSPKCCLLRCWSLVHIDLQPDLIISFLNQNRVQSGLGGRIKSKCVNVRWWSGCIMALLTRSSHSSL